MNGVTHCIVPQLRWFPVRRPHHHRLALVLSCHLIIGIRFLFDVARQTAWIVG